MKQNKASMRYAKALLNFAIESNELDKVSSDVFALMSVLKESNEFALMVKSAVIQEEKKISIFKVLFNDKLSEITLNFLMLIAKNSRSSLIPNILDSFKVQYQQYKNIVTVEITTASKLDETSKLKLASILERDGSGCTVEIEEKINKDLIGGFIFRTDTHQIDASISNKLKSLRRALNNRSYTIKL